MVEVEEVVAEGEEGMAGEAGEGIQATGDATGAEGMEAAFRGARREVTPARSGLVSPWPCHQCGQIPGLHSRAFIRTAIYDATRTRFNVHWNAVL